MRSAWIVSLFYVALVALMHWFVAGRLNIYFIGETRFAENQSRLLLLAGFNIVAGLAIGGFAWRRRGFLWGLAVLGLSILIYVLMLRGYVTDDGYRSVTYIGERWQHLWLLPAVMGLALAQMLILFRPPEPLVWRRRR